MPDRPNVLLLIFDTLRRDAVSRYGPGADGTSAAATAASASASASAFASASTPAFDSVAERGTTFDRAFAAGPFTPPSHGALFSGRYPSDTGFAGPWPAMPADVTLLAERLREAGYDTLGVPGPAKMGSATGLDRGFDDYYEVYEEVAERPSAAYLRQLLTDEFVRRDFLRLCTRGNDYYTQIKFERLREMIASAEPPFFGMANVTTAHAPYDPPRPYKRSRTPELSRPRIPLVEEFADAERLDRDDVRADRLFRAADGGDGDRIALRQYEDGSYLSEAELDVLRRWYLASVDYLDDRLAAFLAWFERRGYADDTVVILTSDHGECFGEHGAMYHGTFLHDPVLRVPLAVAGPGVPEGRRRDPVSLVDLFDTICDLAGVDAPPETAGRPLFGDAESRDAVFAEEAITELTDPAAHEAASAATRREFELGRKSIRTADRRYELRSDGSERLYRADGERIVDPDESAVAPLRDRLIRTLGREFPRADGDESDAELSAGVERNLRELGYI